ncbi:MAG: sigma-54 dependent transcriptional regulator [Bacteroidota bacterium]
MLVANIVRILLIEDEDFDVRRVRHTLEPFADQLQIRNVVSHGDAALELLRVHGEEFDVVIMDMQIAGGLMGEQLIRAIKRLQPSLQIIVITKMTVNITDYEFAHRLLKAGAFWYCTKYPTDIENAIYQPTDFILSIVNAAEKRLLEHKHERSERKLIRNAEEMLSRTRLLGISPSLQKLRGQIKQLGTTEATVLISGASGTGKELVAAQIHYESARRLENYIPINCGSIPDDLVESELFGYEKGAFTGADRAKQGLFEAGHRGTIFLDEVGELPMAAQVKLLRVLQEGEIEKIGRTTKTKVDVRIIAATNKVLQKEVAAGRFREDLFYRLNVVPIHIPPLKERTEDIPVLWEHFLRMMSVDMGVAMPPTDDGAYRVLTSYPWPGNVRELKNVVQRLLLMGESSITADVASDYLSIVVPPHASSLDAISFKASDVIRPLREMERLFRLKYFQFVRQQSASDADAAKKLGLAPPNYHRMSKDLGMKE